MQEKARNKKLKKLPQNCTNEKRECKIDTNTLQQQYVFSAHKTKRQFAKNYATIDGHSKKKTRLGWQFSCIVTNK